MAKVSLDFTGVETSSRMSAGVHRVTVNSSEIKKSDSGNSMIAVSYKNAAGEVAYDNFVLVPQALWKLKIFIEAVFAAPIAGKIDLDPAILKGKSLMISVEDEEYITSNGQTSTRSRVTTDYKPISVSQTLGVEPKVVVPTAKAKPAPVVVAPTPTPTTPVVPVEPIVAIQEEQVPEPVYEKPAQETVVEQPAESRPKFPWEK